MILKLISCKQHDSLQPTTHRPGTIILCATTHCDSGDMGHIVKSKLCATRWDSYDDQHMTTHSIMWCLHVWFRHIFHMVPSHTQILHAWWYNYKIHDCCTSTLCNTLCVIHSFNMRRTHSTIYACVYAQWCMHYDVVLLHSAHTTHYIESHSDNTTTVLCVQYCYVQCVTHQIMFV